MASPIVRMYVDENGHQSLRGDLSNDSKRYLCLTGVIMQPIEHERLEERLSELKIRCFGRPDIVLHRRELISAVPPFEALKDPTVREAFNNSLLDIVRDMHYRVISIVIDKKKHLAAHGLLKAHDPYAMALEYLMQRYLYWMQDYEKQHGACQGDILAESRGGREDLLTKSTYEEIYAGRGYYHLRNTQRYFSSQQIKLKPKTANIAGLQFVDMLSHPARRYILSANGLAPDIKKSSFEQSIADILAQSKFRRNGKGIIDGYGAVLDPK